MSTIEWTVYNPQGPMRVIVTKKLPGGRWLDLLTDAGCRVEVCPSFEVLSVEEIAAAIGPRCDGAIGQLTESWGEPLFGALAAAGGRAYSNYAVGYNNVDLPAATRHAIPVGNTPGVLTESTAQMAVALTFAAARRLGESERFLRDGRYTGWLPDLFLGSLLWRSTVGVVGAGRIGEAYARMMVEGHKMDLLYYDLVRNESLEAYVTGYGEFLQSQGLAPVSCRRVKTVEALLERSDCVSLHTALDASTRHLINGERLALMKRDAVLVNTSRGPVIDEDALVAHCRRHPEFRVGLDVFENEPQLAPGLRELENVVIVPHIASATRYSREGMAAIAAANVAGILRGDPLWKGPDISAFLGQNPPRAIPSIVNTDVFD